MSTTRVPRQLRVLMADIRVVKKALFLRAKFILWSKAVDEYQAGFFDASIEDSFNQLQKKNEARFSNERLMINNRSRSLYCKKARKECIKTALTSKSEEISGTDKIKFCIGIIFGLVISLFDPMTAYNAVGRAFTLDTVESGILVLVIWALVVVIPFVLADLAKKDSGEESKGQSFVRRVCWLLWILLGLLLAVTRFGADVFVQGGGKDAGNSGGLKMLGDVNYILSHGIYAGLMFVVFLIAGLDLYLIWRDKNSLKVVAALATGLCDIQETKYDWKIKKMNAKITNLKQLQEKSGEIINEAEKSVKHRVREEFAKYWGEPGRTGQMPNPSSQVEG